MRLEVLVINKIPRKKKNRFIVADFSRIQVKNTELKMDILAEL